MPSVFNSFFKNIPQELCDLLPGPGEFEAIEHAKGVEDTLSYTPAQLGGYFHKYFPKSYIETYDMFGNLLKYSSKYSQILSTRRELRVLDIGAGIGGNLCGFLRAVSERLPQVESVFVCAVDGNSHALTLLEKHVKALRLNFVVTIRSVEKVFASKTMIQELDDILKPEKPFDMVMASKFINELYRKDPSLTGLYHHFIGLGKRFLSDAGLLMITELTDCRTGNTKEWLNVVFNKESRKFRVCNTKDLKQIYPIPCYLWGNTCTESWCYIQKTFDKFPEIKTRVFVQIFCTQGMGAEFFDKRLTEAWSKKSWRIKPKNLSPKNALCFSGRLRDA